MINYEIKLTDKKAIKVGDTILHNGELKTINTNDITTSQMMGLCIFGDSYNLGYKQVKKAIVYHAK